MKELTSDIKKFVKARDWEQFHSPKNLAIALSVESSELLEIFTWLKEDDVRRLIDSQMENIRDEVGDIFIYLINFCDKLNLDPIECAKNKLEKNNHKYPAELVKGKAKKYSEY